MIKTLPKVLETKHYLKKLKQGDEQGLNYFYQLLFTPYFKRAECFVKDDAIAAYITQEAFLRLWVCRKVIKDVQHLYDFLFKQIREAVDSYYNKASTRFQRSLLRLDAIEDYQEFMLGYEMERDEQEDTVYLDTLEEEKQQQLARVNALLPNLSEQQQLFIKLCLKYSFNYDRIAWHLGGISDYEVANKIEKTIATIKAILCNDQQLITAAKPKHFVCEGGLSDQQAQILNMRYELQYSFEEIATALDLKDTHVRKLFVEAYAVIKNRKSA